MPVQSYLDHHDPHEVVGGIGAHGGTVADLVARSSMSCVVLDDHGNVVVTNDACAHLFGNIAPGDAFDQRFNLQGMSFLKVGSTMRMGRHKSRTLRLKTPGGAPHLAAILPIRSKTARYVVAIDRNPAQPIM